MRLISRLMVEAARPSSVAMERTELPATTAREISSRSANVSANLDLRRVTGLIPPVSAKMRCIDEWFRSNSWRSVEESRFLPVIPHQFFLAFGVIGPRSLLHLQHSFCLHRV